MLSETVRNAIRQIWLFRSLSDTQTAELGRLLNTQNFAQGTIIFHQGDPGDCLYIILTGQVRIYLSAPDGREATIRLYGRGQAFGEFAVLDGQPRTASAIAHTNLTTLVLFRNEFQSLLRSNFELTQQLLKMLVERLRYTTAYSEQVTFLKTEARVASLLLHLASLDAYSENSVHLNLTQDELASYLNTSRVWVNKALSQLTDEKLIRRERGSIIVLSIKDLRRYLDDAQHSLA